MTGLYFQTSSGNRYFYHNGTGFIFPESHIPSHLPESIETCPHVDTQIVQNQLSTRGFRELILEVSQCCNFRCRYCCYSEHYQNTRNHGNGQMTFSTAKRAVDYYMQEFSKSGRGNIWRNPIVAFYGGEPLLNFSLIRRTVQYIKDTYPTFHTEYTITTNASLLTEAIMDFLVEHKFSIIISFDGDEKNHDRNRLDIQNNTTFHTVYSAIKQFRKRYPNYLKFGISLCFDYKTDLFSLSDFLEQEKLFVVSMSMILDQDTDYYEQFTEKDKQQFFYQYNTLKNKYLELAKNGDAISMEYGILLPLFAFEYLEFSAHSIYKEKRVYGMPYTGSCIPGEKIYTTIDGSFHICEKINPNYSIGNIHDGLDYQKIAELENAMNRNFEKCRLCSYSKFCNICFARCAGKDHLEISSDYCRTRKKTVLELLRRYTEIMEQAPTSFDQFASGYFEKMHQITGNVVD